MSWMFHSKETIGRLYKYVINHIGIAIGILRSYRRQGIGLGDYIGKFRSL